jgi:thioredoxin 2
MHTVCPNCNAINRMPAVRLKDKPSCGQCHADIFTGHPPELTTRSFERHVGHNDIPVVVDFWAPWCGPCRLMAPEFEQASRELEPDVRLAKVNTEAEPSLGERFGIRGIPTLALFVAGREVARHSGAMRAVEIVRWVHSHV